MTKRDPLRERLDAVVADPNATPTARELATRVLQELDVTGDPPQLTWEQMNTLFGTDEPGPWHVQVFVGWRALLPWRQRALQFELANDGRLQRIVHRWSLWVTVEVNAPYAGEAERLAVGAMRDAMRRLQMPGEPEAWVLEPVRPFGEQGRRRD